MCAFLYNALTVLAKNSDLVDWREILRHVVLCETQRAV